MFGVIKLKKVLLVCFIFILSLGVYLGAKIITKQVNSPYLKKTVVIDAGHGGIDGGSVGVSTNVSEATLNLDYAKCLKKLMEEFGFRVVMTRTTENGLYNPLASNKKKDDMKKRSQIVENSNADFVISIHMNSFTAKAQGAQVFYGKNDQPSQSLADNIQKYFVRNLTNARKESKVGDYFMLNAIKSPSVLVECGYLSNAEEEALLITEAYRYEVCYSILCGVLEYLR